MTTRLNVAGVIVASALVSLAVLSACANTISAGSDAPPVQPPTPMFTGADSSTATEPDSFLCNAYECPAPYATCPDTSGLCTTNLENDLNHCGDCDTVCPNTLNILKNLHATFLCASNRCQMLCSAGHADCDATVDDGCETNTDGDPNNCGSCGATCPAGKICWFGACGCPTGYTQCGGDCVKTENDIHNCGSCANECDPATAPNTMKTWPCGKDVFPDNTTFDCAKSACGVICAPGFGDCNGNACSDGCETDVYGDPNHCGDCMTKCAPGQICSGGDCICGPDKTRCGTNCVDLENDPQNCGACGNTCPGHTGDDYSSRGSPLCVLGRCTYHCPPDYADCDDDIANGCEANLKTDPNHCGSCNVHCDIKGGQPCGAGRCLTKPCDAGVVH